MSSLVAFIIGAGPNVTASVGATLKVNGYRVAFGSRNPDVAAVKAQGFFPIVVDATEAESIRAAFDVVAKELGAPNVVVYNAGALGAPPDPADPLSVSAADFDSTVALGVNVLHAAKAALPGFRLPQHASSPKTFIVTGNILSFVPPTKPLLVSLGTQKVVEAHLVEAFARAYEKEGIRFYYACLVSGEGEIPDMEIFRKSGPVHGKVYWDLIRRKELGNWDHRFTFEGKKYEGY